MVLHPSAIVVLIVMLHLLLVGHHQLVILLHVNVAALAHLMRIQTRLRAIEMLVETSLEHGVLVSLCLLHHTQAAIAGSTSLQARPEIGELVNHFRIVIDGSSKVACLVAQHTTVEECQHVVGFEFQHEVEVGNGAVVVADLGSQQSSVVVSKKVVGFQVKGRIVVGHCPTKVILIKPCQRAVDVVATMLGQQMDGLVELFLCLLPLTSRKADDAAHRPGLSVIRVNVEALLQRGNGLGCVFLQHIDLSLHCIASGIAAPARQHRIEFGMSRVVLLILNTAQHTVMPKILVFRLIPQSPRIIGNSIRKLLLLNARQSSKLVDLGHVGIALQGFAAIALGTCEVVEIVLCNSTEEPRLVKPRLGTDGLIEVLNGEHIVFIVKCCSSIHHQALSIILGKTLCREERRVKSEECCANNNTQQPTSQAPPMLLGGRKCFILHAYRFIF